MKTRMGNVMLGAMLVILLTTGIGHADLSTGLVGYWSFDNPSALGHDDSGTGNNGSPVGGASPTSGVLGGGVHLNGAGFIQIPDSPSLDLPGARGTICAFIKVDSSSNEFGIVSKESSSSYASQIAYEFNVVGTGVLNIFGLGLSNGSSMNGVSYNGTSFKDSMWHHVAATFDGPGGQMVAYKDGVPVGYANQTIATINNISEPLRIGTYRWNVSGMYRTMTGDMDEVRIYNRALSESEIQQLAGIAIAGTIDIDPDTLNISSKGKWVTCYIELPDGYDVMDIDGSTVMLEGIPAYIGAEGWARAGANSGNIMDHDGDGILERMVKFDGAAVRGYLIGLGASGYVGLTVTGDLVDGPSFEGIDVIRVID